MRTATSPLFGRLLVAALRRTPSPPVRFGIATLVVVAVALARAFLVTALLPWLLFIPTVLLLALALGETVGLYATLLSAACAGVSIALPNERHWLTAPQWVATATFVLTGFGIVFVATQLRAAFRQMDHLLVQRDADHRTIADREAFLSSVLASSTDCIKVLDLDGRLTFMSDGGQRVMEVGDFNAIAGCPWPDFWHGQGNVEARAAIEAAHAGQARSFVGKAATMAGTMRWWDVAVSPIPGPDGRPERILSVSRDITASREREEEQLRLTRIVENSLDFIGIARLDGSVFFLNDAALALVGLDRAALPGLAIADFFPPDEAAIVRDEILPAVLRDGSWSGERRFRHFVTGEPIPVLYTVFPVHDGDGSLIGYGTVTRDFRERKAAEDRQHLLNEELSHRLKNVLSVVQAVASQTLRQAIDLPSANAALGARLAALGEATNVLTAGAWAAADLARLIEKALAPHGAIGERFRLAGPPILLKPQVSLALALALHELATNAAKYGALSAADGRVDVRWWVEDAAGTPRFRLRWQESGGPAVAAPQRRGFGSMMIERSLKAYFAGEVMLDYAAAGFVFDLDAPLAEAGQQGTAS
jgi:PAS domain S-box-containing protein